MISRWTARPHSVPSARHELTHGPVMYPLLGCVLLGNFLLGSLLLAGCSLFDDGSSKDRGVRASVQNEVLVVKNSRSDSVWTFAAGTRLLARVSLAPPSLDGDPIPPGGTQRIEIDDIPMDDMENSITVFWWPAVMEDGKRVAGPRSSFKVDL